MIHYCNIKNRRCQAEKRKKIRFFISGIFAIQHSGSGGSKYGRHRLPGAGNAALPRSMRASSPHAFFIYLFFYFIYLASGGCLRRPASRRWTATRSRTLTARKMPSTFFRSFDFAISFFCCFANFFFFCLRRPASRRWTATRSTDLDREKNAQHIFP